jgi:hypothetical protein
VTESRRGLYGVPRTHKERAETGLRSDVQWTLAELRSECEPALREQANVEKILCPFNFVEGELDERFDLDIGNPPFSLAEQFLDRARQLADVVVLLERLSFLGSDSRAHRWHGYTPDVYVLPNRPSFTNDGKTDSADYAWFVWGPPGIRASGNLRVLGTTPGQKRRAR